MAAPSFVYLISFRVQTVMAAYRDKVLREQGELSRAERNEQTKARNANRKKVLAARVADIGAGRLCRSSVQQIAELDKRLGVGKGAKKERARLIADKG